MDADKSLLVVVLDLSFQKKCPCLILDPREKTGSKETFNRDVYTVWQIWMWGGWQDIEPLICFSLNAFFPRKKHLNDGLRRVSNIIKQTEKVYMESLVRMACRKDRSPSGTMQIPHYYSLRRIGRKSTESERAEQANHFHNASRGDRVWQKLSMDYRSNVKTSSAS